MTYKPGDRVRLSQWVDNARQSATLVEPYETRDDRWWVLTENRDAEVWLTAHFELVDSPQEQDTTTPELREGDRVKHETLGEGRIITEEERDALSFDQHPIDRVTGLALVKLDRVATGLREGVLVTHTAIALNLLTKVEPGLDDDRRLAYIKSESAPSDAVIAAMQWDNMLEFFDEFDPPVAEAMRNGFAAPSVEPVEEPNEDELYDAFVDYHVAGKLNPITAKRIVKAWLAAVPVEEPKEHVAFGCDEPVVVAGEPFRCTRHEGHDGDCESWNASVAAIPVEEETVTVGYLRVEEQKGEGVIDVPRIEHFGDATVAIFDDDDDVDPQPEGGVSKESQNLDTSEVHVEAINVSPQPVKTLREKLRRETFRCECSNDGNTAIDTEDAFMAFREHYDSKREELDANFYDRHNGYIDDDEYERRQRSILFGEQS